METETYEFCITLINCANDINKSKIIYELPGLYDDLINEVNIWLGVKEQVELHYKDFDGDVVNIGNDKEYAKAIDYVKKNSLSELKIFVNTGQGFNFQDRISGFFDDRNRFDRNGDTIVSPSDFQEFKLKSNDIEKVVRTIKIKNPLNYQNDPRMSQVTDLDYWIVEYEDWNQNIGQIEQADVMYIPRSKEAVDYEIKRIAKEVEDEESKSSETKPQNKCTTTSKNYTILEEFKDNDIVSEFAMRESITSDINFNPIQKKTINEDSKRVSLSISEAAINYVLSKNIPDLKQQLEYMAIVSKTCHNIGTAGVTVTQKWIVTNQSDYQWPDDIFLYPEESQKLMFKWNISRSIMPEEQTEIWAEIKIPMNVRQNDLFSPVFRLRSKEFGKIGQILVWSIKIDRDEYINKNDLIRKQYLNMEKMSVGQFNRTIRHQMLKF